MSYVKLLGFSTLSCGCVIGRYRDVGTSREVTYVEQKGDTCRASQHRRNQPLRPATLAADHPRAEPARAF